MCIRDRHGSHLPTDLRPRSIHSHPSPRPVLVSLDVPVVVCHDTTEDVAYVVVLDFVPVVSRVAGLPVDILFEPVPGVTADDPVDRQAVVLLEPPRPRVAIGSEVAVDTSRIVARLVVVGQDGLDPRREIADPVGVAGVVRYPA